AANIPASEARGVVHVMGKTVTAGLIDLHPLVVAGVAANGVHPDIAGVHAGVTTVVDAGSSGCATFSAFPRHILPKCETEGIPLLHICQTGLATNPDTVAESGDDLYGALRVAQEHKGLIKGSRRAWSRRRSRSSGWRCRAWPSARPARAGYRSCATSAT